MTDYDKKAEELVRDFTVYWPETSQHLVEIVAAAMRDAVAERDAEIARIQTANGQLIADLMWCRDGAAVHDLRAEIVELKKQIYHGNARIVALQVSIKEWADKATAQQGTIVELRRQLNHKNV